METALAITQQHPDLSVVPADVSAGALQAALGGDISKLTAEDRLKYYGALCRFTGLNPLSKPFDWITLQGKLVLYANKGCAEQLRKIHHVTTEILERKVELGCYVVRVKATDGNGRVDESIGAVPFDDRMSPADKANALMKCETKAKRRVTLSIVGLGMLDESELDTMKEARRAEAVSQVVDNLETSTDRAAALNSLVSDPVEAEITSTAATEPPPPAGSPQELSGDSNTVAAASISTASGSSSFQPERPSAETDPAPAGASNPVKVETLPAGSLPEETVRNLEIVLTEKNQAQAMKFLTARGYLKPGADLATLSMELATKILKSPTAFHRSVETWAKTAKA